MMIMYWSRNKKLTEKLKSLAAWVELSWPFVGKDMIRPNELRTYDVPSIDHAKLN
jgi:hypothetical protein